MQLPITAICKRDVPLSSQPTMVSLYIDIYIYVCVHRLPIYIIMFVYRSSSTKSKHRLLYVYIQTYIYTHIYAYYIYVYIQVEPGHKLTKDCLHSLQYQICTTKLCKHEALNCELFKRRKLVSNPNTSLE